MPMKLMVRVRPGVELTWASFCPSRELMRLDLPTFERPRNANSGGPSSGNPATSVVDVMNLARIGFKPIVCHKVFQHALLARTFGARWTVAAFRALSDSFGQSYSRLLPLENILERIQGDLLWLAGQ